MGSLQGRRCRLVASDGICKQRSSRLLGTGSAYHELLTTVLAARNDRVVYAVFSFSAGLLTNSFSCPRSAACRRHGKGRASLHSSDVANAFEKHYALTVDDPDELAAEAMTKKLEQEMRCVVQLT